MPTKKRKPDVCTRYAVRKGQKYWGFGSKAWGTFDNAILFEGRYRAVAIASYGEEIVPVRCRALSAATKRSKKRTR